MDKGLNEKVYVDERYSTKWSGFYSFYLCSFEVYPKYTCQFMFQKASI